MENKKEKIAEKIRKKEEELKRLKKQEAELKKLEKEREEKRKKQWFNGLNKKLDAFLQGKYGADYMEKVQQDQILQILEVCMETEKQEGKSDEDRSGYETID